MGEDGGELAVNEREGPTKGGRPCLVGRHLLKIQELSKTLPGFNQEEKLFSMANDGLEVEKAEQSERIKTRHHHLFILPNSLIHTLAENETNSVGLVRISLLELAI